MSSIIVSILIAAGSSMSRYKRMTDAFTEHGPRCPKCGKKEVYIQSDGKTLRCWECKHVWLGSWVKEDER